MTAAVIKSQQQDLVKVLKSAASRVDNLERYAKSVERYAKSVKAVEATDRDWIGAQQAERLDERVRDIHADTARDELAAEELKTLTERTVAAEQALRHSIQETNLPAEALALPDENGP